MGEVDQLQSVEGAIFYLTATTLFWASRQSCICLVRAHRDSNNIITISPVAQSMSLSTVGHTFSNWTIASQNLAAQVAPSCDYEEDIPHNDSSSSLLQVQEFERKAPFFSTFICRDRETRQLVLCAVSDYLG